MNSSTLSLRTGQIAIPLLAAMCGVIAGVKPTYGIAMALAVVYVVLTLSNLALGIALFMTMSFFEDLTLGGGLTIAKFGGGVLLLAWLALANDSADLRGRGMLREHTLATFVLLALTGYVAAGVVWAHDPHIAAGAISRWWLNLVLFPVVLAGITDRRSVRWVFVFFVIGALLSGAAGIVIGGAQNVAVDAADDVRLGGSGINPNELGQLLMVSVVLCGFLGACRDIQSATRALAYGAGALSLLFLMMTVSREAILGLVLSLLAAPFVIGRGRRLGAVLLAVATIAGGAIYLVGFAPAADLDRIVHSDSTGSGRTDLWRIGLREFKAHPLTGVGPDNFSAAGAQYLLQPGLILRSDHILDQGLTTHNVYLELLAEIGIIGLGLVLTIFGFALRCLWQAANRFAAAGDQPLEMLSRGLLIAMVGYLASDFFSTATYSKQLWIFLAMSVALLRMGNRAVRERDAEMAAA